MPVCWTEISTANARWEIVTILWNKNPHLNASPPLPTPLLSELYKYLCPISGLSDELPELKLNKHLQKKLIILLSVQKTWNQLLTP